MALRRPHVVIRLVESTHQRSMPSASLCQQISAKRQGRVIGARLKHLSLIACVSAHGHSTCPRAMLHQMSLAMPSQEAFSPMTTLAVGPHGMAMSLKDKKLMVFKHFLISATPDHRQSPSRARSALLLKARRSSAQHR